MSKILRALMFFLIFLLPFQLMAKDNLTEDEKLNQGWVIKSIYFTDGGEIAVVNVKALIEAPPEKVWQLLTNIKGWSSWMPMLSQAFVINSSGLAGLSANPQKNEQLHNKMRSLPMSYASIGNQGKKSLTTFEEFDLPWPINNDWVIREYTFDASGANSSNYKVSWHQIFEGCTGRGGSWKLTPYNANNDNDTLFEYNFRVFKKKEASQGIFRTIIGQTAQRFVEAIRKNL